MTYPTRVHGIVKYVDTITYAFTSALSPTAPDVLDHSLWPASANWCKFLSIRGSSHPLSMSVVSCSARWSKSLKFDAISPANSSKETLPISQRIYYEVKQRFRKTINYFPKRMASICWKSKSVSYDPPFCPPCVIVRFAHASVESGCESSNSFPVCSPVEPGNVIFYLPLKMPENTLKKRLN